MASKRNKKKKKNIAADEYGDKDIPYTTNERALQDYGIEVIQGSSEKKRKRKQQLAVGIVGIFVAIYGISVVSSLTANGRINNLSEVVKSQESPAFKTRYDSLGKSVIEDYYSQKQTPVNLLNTAVWSTDNKGGTTVKNSSSSDKADSSIPVEVESLSLINAYEETPQMGELEDDVKEVMTNPKLEILTYSGTIDGKQYKFGVTLLVPDIKNPAKLPYLVYAPTMMPMDDLLRVDAEASKPQAGETGKYTEFTLSEDAVDTIDDWASAYAQNDGEILKRITGDNDPQRSYKGIGGFTLEGTPSVEWSYAYTPEQDENTDIAIARISFNMITEVNNNSNNNLSGKETNNSFIVPQTLDIMLHGFSSGTPNIVAWTQAGNWQNLENRMNAIIVPEDAKQQEGNSDVLNESPQTSEENSEISSENNTPVAPSLEPKTTERTTSSSSSDEEDTTSSKKENKKNKSSTKKKVNSDKSTHKSSKRTSDKSDK